MSFPNFSFPILFPRISHAATNLLWLLFFFLFLPVETVHSPAKDGQKRKNDVKMSTLYFLRILHSLPSWFTHFPSLFYLLSPPFLTGIGSTYFPSTSSLPPSLLCLRHPLPFTLQSVGLTPPPPPPTKTVLSVLKEKNVSDLFHNKPVSCFYFFFLPFLATAPSGSSSSDNSNNIAVAAGSNIFLCRTSILLYTHF